MILRFIGGRDDGVEIDTESPGNWAATNDEMLMPCPEIIRMHSARANRAVYRMIRATPDDCTYQLDPCLTAEYRADDVRP